MFTSLKLFYYPETENSEKDMYWANIKTNKEDNQWSKTGLWATSFYLYDNQPKVYQQINKEKEIRNRKNFNSKYIKLIIIRKWDSFKTRETEIQATDLGINE